jgi:hypothetical protein
VHERIEDGRQELIVDPEAQASAPALRKLLEEIEMATQVALEARELVEGNMNMEAEMDRLSFLYDQLAELSKGRAS